MTARFTERRGRGMELKLADVDMDVWERPLERKSLGTVTKYSYGVDGSKGILNGI
jgi:hypothetical protein